MQKIYINTTTRQWFDTDGALFGSGSPQLAYKRTEEIALQLCSETPDAGTDGVNPETDWTKDSSFGVGGIGAKLSIDNDFLRRRKGTLSADIPAGSVSTVTAEIEGASKATIRASGILKVFNADGNAEALEYESATFSENSVTFTLKSGSEVESSYAQGVEMDVPDALYAQAMMDSEKSDAAAGLFVFNIVVYSEKLRAVMEYANIANLDTLAGMELLLFKTFGDTITELNNFLCTTVSLHATMAEANTLAQVPPSMTDELVSLITSTLGDVQYEYSEDGTNWHSTRTDADNYFRFKLTGSGSSGTWIIANMINGTTPHIGANGNWWIGSTDTGVKAEISGSYIEFSAVDSSGNYTLAGTITVPYAVLTNAGNFYPVEKGSVTVNTTLNTVTLNVAPYLAYDNAGSFSGTWRLYFAAGSSEVVFNGMPYAALTGAASVTIPAGGSAYTLTIGQDTTITFPSPGNATCYFWLYLTTGSTVYSVTLPNSIAWEDGIGPDLSAVSSLYRLAFLWDAPNQKWLGSLFWPAEVLT